MSVEFQVRVSRDDFEIEAACITDARVVALEGPSGAGKTTILQGLAGLLPVHLARLAIDGSVLVDTASGIIPPPHRRGIGFVFQDLRLFPHLTVGDNIGFGARFVEHPMSVDAALDLVDLNGFASRWPNSLSGGEARRVAIARALCSAPRILFLDEPLTGLDLARRDSVMPYLRRLRDETLIPILLVSHDPRDLADLADVRVHVGQ
jgi:molybdate transport system ATP-binding protein